MSQIYGMVIMWMNSSRHAESDRALEVKIILLESFELLKCCGADQANFKTCLDMCFYSFIQPCDMLRLCSYYLWILLCMCDQ